MVFGHPGLRLPEYGENRKLHSSEKEKNLFVLTS
jgi:hypothetical protein